MDRFVLRADRFLLSEVKPVFILGLDLMDGTAERGKVEDPLIRSKVNVRQPTYGTHYLCVCRH